MSGRFVSVDRDTAYLLPPSVQEWLPGNHLARFVVEIVEQLDLSELTRGYRGRGSEAFHPAMMVALLFYGCATGVFSSRKLERATFDSVAMRYVAANNHPDHDTIADFRQRLRKEIKALFVQILGVARQLGVLKLGNVTLDGTKIHANASKHSALSWEHACKIEAQLQAEVEELMRLADAADQAEIPDGMSIPEELERRAERLAAIAQAKAAIEGRAVCPGAGGVRAKDSGANGAGRAHGPQARRDATRGAATRATAQGSDQSDRRGLADHAHLGWWV